MQQAPGGVCVEAKLRRVYSASRLATARLPVDVQADGNLDLVGCSRRGAKPVPASLLGRTARRLIHVDQL